MIGMAIKSINPFLDEPFFGEFQRVGPTRVELHCFCKYMQKIHNIFSSLNSKEKTTLFGRKRERIENV